MAFSASEGKGFIGHNFGDYKNQIVLPLRKRFVLSVTILETTKTDANKDVLIAGFIGHNFGDYKNSYDKDLITVVVLSVTILETTKTSNSIS